MSRDARDGLRVLADDDGVTLDQEITRLVRAERQRRMGRALATIDLGPDDAAWIEMGVDAAGRDASR